MIHVAKFYAWAPGLEDLAHWREWALGLRFPAIPGDGEEAAGPDLSFTPPLFRRRLSLISKMTVRVAHELLPFSARARIFFLSLRGEIGQQFKISCAFLEEALVRPASFSHSVFNTPVAMASIVLGLTAGYTALYSGEGGFYAGFQAAAAPLLAGDADESVLIYADEAAPEEYGRLCPPDNLPLAFGVALSRAEGRRLAWDGRNRADFFGTSKSFLRHVCLDEASGQTA
ncbi:MAG: beta-ketoacyl synthase chain length factor [Desulfovibrionaceae bacterium]|nr:beta-ketoacyl synthase chain length factor [Desulfovibrionaceae bacterium]